MDDIDSYYTERPAYPRPPPANRTYPPVNVRYGPPPYGRPQMGGPMGGPMRGPMGGPMRVPTGGPMGRPMGPAPMNGRPMGPASMNEMTRGPAPGMAPMSQAPFKNDDMMPAPLSLRRTPPPQEETHPQSRRSPSMTSPRVGMKPLNSIGAPRMRSPSPALNKVVRPLDSIGAPRPPRSSSARPEMQRRRQPELLAPQWDVVSRQRSASANTPPRSPAVDTPLSPYQPISPLDTSDSAFRDNSLAAIAATPAVRPMGSVSPRQDSADDIHFGADFFEEIQVGPYRGLDVPPPVPRKNSIKPSVASQILAPSVPARIPSPMAAAARGRPQSPEDDSPPPADRGLRSMWLGDIQAGPYADAAPPMPAMPSMPDRSFSKSPPVNCPDMSEPTSDVEDNFDNAPPLQDLFAGLRIQTDESQPTLLSATKYNPNQRDSSDSSYQRGQITPLTPEKDNRDSYATDVVDMDDSRRPSHAELPATPRKRANSVCDYMSMDQLEAMWGQDDKFVATSSFGGGYFPLDPAPIMAAETHRGGQPF